MLWRIMWLQVQAGSMSGCSQRSNSEGLMEWLQLRLLHNEGLEEHLIEHVALPRRPASRSQTIGDGLIHSSMGGRSHRCHLWLSQSLGPITVDGRRLELGTTNKQHTASCIVPWSGQQMVGSPSHQSLEPCSIAADIASSRKGQQMSVKSLQHRWKHEIQIALLRRRASMTRTHQHEQNGFSLVS